MIWLRLGLRLHFLAWQSNSHLGGARATARGARLGEGA